jgi:hypothetical protein
VGSGINTINEIPIDVWINRGILKWKETSTGTLTVAEINR